MQITDKSQMAYPTHHNRLLDYEVSTMDPNGQPVDLLRTVDYTYYKTGQASNVTVKDEYVAGVTPGDPNAYVWHYDLALYYFSHGPLKRALWGRWDDTGEVTVYEADLAREFRFDGARARYIAADYDPNDAPTQPPRWTPLGSPLLTDYDGVTPYLDGGLDLNTYDYTALRSYFGTAGHADVASGAEAYYHGDLIDSAMLTTDSAGASVASVAYTAFGEPGGAGVSPASLDTRYQYAGGWGYESDLLGLQGANTSLPALTFQHLGWRWYQPDTGRFIQRDPIGLWGGLNVFGYAINNPLIFIDPTGAQVDVSDEDAWEAGKGVLNGIIDIGTAGLKSLGELLWNMCVLLQWSQNKARDSVFPDRPTTPSLPPGCTDPDCPRGGRGCPGVHIGPKPPPVPPIKDPNFPPDPKDPY